MSNRKMTRWLRLLGETSIANWIWFWTALNSIGFVAGSYHFFLFDMDRIVRRVEQVRETWPLLPLHVSLGTLWALCGILQFVPLIRRRAIRVHRILGRVFLVSALASVVTADVMTILLGTRAFITPKSGLIQGTLALLCAGMAYWTIRFRGDVQRHRGWVLRSFAVMYSIMFPRAIAFLFLSVPSLPVEWFPTLPWRLAFVLVVAELINYRVLDARPLRASGALIRGAAGCVIAAVGAICFYSTFAVVRLEGSPALSTRFRRTPQVPASAPPGSEDGLVSDFEDGTPSTRFGHGWEVFTDRRIGGGSSAVLTVVPGGGDDSSKALRIAGETVNGRPPRRWAGARFSPGTGPLAPANLSSKSEIVFWARGDGRSFVLSLTAVSRGRRPAIKPFETTDAWRQYRFRIDEFEGLDGYGITGMTFTTGQDPGSFWLEIDGVEFR
jgi:hypothetical protein